MKLSAIIPCRDEVYCAFTAHRVLETWKAAEVIVVEDGCNHAHPAMPREVRVIGRRGRDKRASIGNCYSRDEGIMSASGDVCVILDAHVNFDSDDWARAAIEFAEQHDGIACYHCWGLSEGRLAMGDGNGLYHGARIKWKDVSNNRPRVLPGRWADFATGPCAAIMGGAYVLRKDWYADKLARCWRNLRGWGHSEPYITLVNHLAGGVCHLLGPRVGHMFRANSHYHINLQDLVHNQLACLALVDDERDRRELEGWLYRGNPKPMEIWPRMATVLKWSDELPRAASWSQYRDRWLLPYMEDDETKPDTWRKIVTRTEVLQAVIDAGNYGRYLEIGVRNVADNFRLINAAVKVGVDPNVTADGVKRMMSADFWRKAKRGSFDVVFVDGDHRYHAVREDVTEALRVVGEGGTVVMHDCLPTSPAHALPEKPNNGNPWNGEAWRVFSERVADPTVDVICIDCDHGVGILRNLPSGASPRSGHRAFSSPPPAPWTLTRPQRDELFRVVRPDLARVAIRQLIGTAPVPGREAGR